MKTSILSPNTRKGKKLFGKERVSETDFYSLMLDIGIDLDKKLVDCKAEG